MIDTVDKLFCLLFSKLCVPFQNVLLYTLVQRVIKSFAFTLGNYSLEQKHPTSILLLQIQKIDLRYDFALSVITGC